MQSPCSRMMRSSSCSRNVSGVFCPIFTVTLPLIAALDFKQAVAVGLPQHPGAIRPRPCDPRPVGFLVRQDGDPPKAVQWALSGATSDPQPACEELQAGTKPCKPRFSGRSGQLSLT